MERIFKRYAPLITGIIVFGMYLLTLAPTVIQIDSGELATAQLRLGIAHPTGYPLFTLIGYLFGKIPLGLRPIYQMNLLAALWCTGAVMIFTHTSIMILSHLPLLTKKPVKVSNKSTKKVQKQDAAKKESVEDSAHPLEPYFASVTGGLILGFSKTFWFQSTSVEVYSMQCCMFTLIIWSALNAYLHSLDNELKGFRYWFIMAGALAFGFSTHMTTLFTLPAIAYLFFSVHGIRKDTFVKIAFLLLTFFPLLAALYAYLPIRATQNPVVNWGNPVDAERFFRLVSGNQYQSWMFSSFDSAKKQLTYFFSNLPFEFNVSAVFIVIGMVYFFIRAKKLAIFFAVLATFTLFYAINYNINDIDSYFLLIYIALAYFGVFGVTLIFRLLYDKQIVYGLGLILGMLLLIHVDSSFSLIYLILAYFGIFGSFVIYRLLYDKKYAYGLAFITVLIFLGIQIYFTIDKVDQHDNYIFEDYARSALMGADSNAVIFSYQWDNFVSPSYYLQHIENVRPDVTVVDKELLRRSWYYNQVHKNSPSVIADLQPDISKFLKGLQKFERNEKYDAQFLETYYGRIMTGLVAANASHRPFYIGIELFEREMKEKLFSLPEGYTLVPDLFYFRVVKNNNYFPARDPDFTIRLPRFDSEYSSSVKEIVCSMLVRRALYEMQFDKRDRAAVYIKKIKQDFPDYAIPHGLAEVLAH